MLLSESEPAIPAKETPQTYAFKDIFCFLLKISYLITVDNIPQVQLWNH
jgi:hypothetical protein